MKINKKIKKICNLYNLAILGCIILILVSLCIIFKPDKKETANGGVEVIQSDKKETEEITEKDARQLAKKQFKKIGEKNIKEEELNVTKIQRNGEEYYYISSAENTLEIQIKGGKVTRINSVAVKE